MRSTSLIDACTLRRRRRLVLVGGFTVPAIVLGTVLGSSVAFADATPTTISSKADLTSAFGSAGTTNSTVSLGANLVAASPDGTSDQQILAGGKSLTIDLAGKNLDLDQIQIAAGASLSVIDTGTTHGSLQIGTSILTAGDNGGVRLSSTGVFTVDQHAQVTVTGSAGLPAVGTTAITATGSKVVVTGGGSLTATGGAGAAGIGGAAPETVTADGGAITATGGTGAAGIGGSMNKGGSTVAIKNGGTVVAQGGGPAGAATEQVNAIGNGQGSTDFGSLTIDPTSKLTVPVGAVEAVPQGAQFTNSGEIDVNGSLKGAGTVSNGGKIIPGSGDAVADALNITGNDYAVTLDAGASGHVAPTTARVLADTFEHGGVSLPDASPNTNFHFNDWKATGGAVGRTTTLTSTGDPATNGAYPVALTAEYGTLVTFSDSSDLGFLSTAQAITTQLNANGTNNGNGKKTWALQSTSSLPAGLTLSADGVLAGAPTQPGAFSFTVDVTGPYNTLAQTYSGSVGVTPVMAATTLPTTKVGATYSQSITATRGTDGTTYTSTALPGGLVLDADGTLHGTPTAAAGGTKTFVVTATNDYGHDSATYTLFTNTIPVFTTTTLPSAVLGTQYSQQIVTTGDGPIDYAVDPSTPLPGRLSLSTTGLLSGIATRSGTTTIKVIAHSAYGTTTENLVFVAGDVPAITTPTVQNPTVGDSTYRQQFTTTGNGDITWSITNKPAGMSFSSTGLLSGPISTSGPYTFTITSTSSFGTVDKDFTIQAGTAPAISTTSIANPVQGVGYNVPLAFTGDDNPMFSATGLPAGLSINPSTGVISGTTTAAEGSAHVVVTATSTWGTAVAPFDITVHVKPAWVTPAALPDTTTGGAVDVQLSAPGSGSTRFTATGLPSTLTLTTAGHLTGHVDASASFSVTATNDYGSTTARTFTIATGDAPEITTTPPSLPAPILDGSTYSTTIAADGDDSPTFTVLSGHLPTGLDIDHTSGVISGTPSAAGSFTFVINAHSKWGDDPQSYTLLVGVPPTIVSSTLIDPTFGRHYDQPVNALVTPGTAVSFSSTGTLPHGLSLDTATGHISGDLATDAVAETFTVTAHTIYGDVPQDYTLTPGSAAHISTVSGDLGTPVASHPFTASIAGSGDGVVYDVTGGALPSGLTLHANGTITGTPATSGPAHFVVTASSAYGDDTATYDLTVASAPSFTTASLGQAIVGMPFLKVIAATGTGAVALHVQGDLPAGISFDPATGTLSGTPTATGTSTVTVVAVSDLATTTHEYAFSAFAAPALATTALAGGTAGTAYSTSIHATGSGDVSYAVTSGALPTGLALNSRTGALTGTPTTAGTATFTVTASSSYGTDSKALTLQIDAAPVVVAPPAPAAPSLPVAPSAKAELGHGFALSVAADSTVPVTYSVKGDLPKGVALNSSTGLISGKPKEAGTFAFSVTAKSSAGSDTQKYTVIVPEIVNLVTGSANWITPIQGQPFAVSVAGLQKGEHWIVQANGRTVKTGTAAKAGTVTTEITLKKAFGDKAYTIRVSGSRSVTDPAKTASDEFVVTAITARKLLKMQRSGSLVKVVNLASREIVALKIDGKTVATGRADEKGLFVYSAKSWSKGTHKVTVTGKTTTRTGSLTVKITK